MAQDTDKTRAEIVQLRQEMARKIAGLRRATERPIRIAKIAAAGTVAVIVVGGVALVVVRARHRREMRSLEGRMKQMAQMMTEPDKTVRKAQKVAADAADGTRERLRAQLRKQLQEQTRDQRPLHEKILTTAAQSAASAAIPIILRRLQDRAEPVAAAESRS